MLMLVLLITVNALNFSVMCTELWTLQH